MRRRIDPWGPEAFLAYARQHGGTGQAAPHHWSKVGPNHHHMPEPRPERATFWQGDGWWVGPVVIVVSVGLGLWMFSIINWEVFSLFTFLCILIGLYWGVMVIGRALKHFAIIQKAKRKRAHEGYTFFVPHFFPRYASAYYWAAPLAIWGLIALVIWIGNAIVG